MPGQCEVVGCHSYTIMKGNKPSFHLFPANPERRQRWIAALKKKRRDSPLPWVPSRCARICGTHFIQGKPNNDPNHPDYVPSIFPHNQKSLKPHRQEIAIGRYDRHIKRSKEKDLSTPTLKGTSTVNKERQQVTAGVSPTDVINVGTEERASPPKKARLATPDHSPAKKETVTPSKAADASIQKVSPQTAVSKCINREETRPPLSAIIKANLLPTTIPVPDNHSYAQVRPDNVFPPCTEKMLFDEITALRSERDRALKNVKELQQKVEVLTEKLKQKREKAKVQVCVACKKKYSKNKPKKGSLKDSNEETPPPQSQKQFDNLLEVIL